MLSFSEINIKEDVVLNEYTNRSIQLSLKSGKQFKFELPAMKIPFGVSESRWNGGPPKYDVQFLGRCRRGILQMDYRIREFYNRFDCKKFTSNS